MDLLDRPRYYFNKQFQYTGDEKRVTMSNSTRNYARQQGGLGFGLYQRRVAMYVPRYVQCFIVA